VHQLLNINIQIVHVQCTSHKAVEPFYTFPGISKPSFLIHAKHRLISVN